MEKLKLILYCPEPSKELQHAVEQLTVKYTTKLDGKRHFVALVTADDSDQTLADFCLDPLPDNSVGQEGYQVQHPDNYSLILAAQSAHGLANALYDISRILKQTPESFTNLKAELSDGIHKPYFQQRDFYHFMTTWNLEHLTCDTFTIEQWQEHLQRMRALNANRFYFDIWADQYYHPDYPETAHNRTLYDKMKVVCQYAHQLGLRTGIYLFPCQVPPAVYQQHPDAQAVEAANYHGINMCPTRNWSVVTAFDAFLLHYMGNDLDDIVVEMQDPGSCLCELCCAQFPELINRFIDLYRAIPGAADRKIDVCSLHFRDWLEAPGAVNTGVAFPIKQLRQKVFEQLPPSSTIIDIDNPTLDMGRDYKLKNNYFFFDLDPESGMENQQVLPRVKLNRIAAQIKKSQAQQHDGLTAYRMMPFAQYVADFTLFRKCWSPELSIDSILLELAAEWGIRASERECFVKAIRALDRWWEAEDITALKSANELIGHLMEADNLSIHFINFAALLKVLTLLGTYLVENRQKIAQKDFYPPVSLVAEVAAVMEGSTIFVAYTIYQHWRKRSNEMIGQRIRWWLQGIAFELKTNRPERQAGN